MKNTCKTILLVLALFLSIVDLGAWGRNGHNAVTAIAEKHMTKKARKAVEEILDGKSIVYWSNWMDRVRKLPDYSYTTHWHMNHVDADGNVVVCENHGKNNADALWGLKNQIFPVLENRVGHSPEFVSENLKYLIHLIADIHCPSHIKYADIKEPYLIYNDERIWHHHIWDSTLLDDLNGWSFSDYAYMLDRADKKEIARICEGGPEEWVAECAREFKVIYTWTEPEMVVGPEYKVKAIEFANKYLMIAGYRLAHVLNELFR